MAGDARVQLPAPIEYNLWPIGFYFRGREFTRAAAAAPREPNRVSVVPYFLHCQAIELGLKAFLLMKGLPKRQLKAAYGHNLTKLLNRAQRDGIGRFVTLSPAETAAIQAATGFYDSGPAGRRLLYFDVRWVVGGFPNLPDLEALASAAAQLTDCEQLEQEYVKAAN